MADEWSMALEGLLRKAQGQPDADFLREGVRVLSQALMELEVSQHVGADRYERTSTRTGRWSARSNAPTGGAAATAGGQPCRERSDPRRVRTGVRATARIQQPRARHGRGAIRDGVP